jgi:lipopolysaccharide export system protein LptA
MKWQKAARLVVAIAGVGVAVALYVSTRERPVAERPATGTVADPDAVLQSSPGKQTRFQDGDTQFTLEYKSLRQLNDGRLLLEGVRMTAEDGTLIVADQTETRGSLADQDLPAEYVLKGHVGLTNPDGTNVTADEATYLQLAGRLTMPGAVAFTRGRVSGRGVGGSYERDTGEFRLLTEATVTGAAAGGQEGFTGSGDSLTFNRATRALRFEADARIDTTQSTMTAGRATLFLTEDTDDFRAIELRGQSHVGPAPAADPSAVPDMRADDIDLAFHAGSQSLQRAVLMRNATMEVGERSSRQVVAAMQITADAAPDGRTLTKLEARDRVSIRTPAREGAPERVTTGTALVATGDAKKGLTAALVSGGVVFVETTPGSRGRPASERRATAASLAMTLGGKLDAIEEARFDENVTFRDGDFTGDSDIGIYRAAKGQLILQPRTPVKRRPHVKSTDVEVEAAERIELDLTSRDLYAVGEVRTISAGQPAKGASDAAFFDRSTPVHGFGREFWYTGRTRNVRYAGATGAPAELRQGERSVLAARIDAGIEGGDLTASGGVESVLILEPDATAKPGSPTRRYKITAQALDYTDAKRVATYTGDATTPVVLTGPDGTTAAERIVLTLARTARTLERLDADTNVHLVLHSGREALADVLEYLAAGERYFLRGQPLVVRYKDEKPDSCREVRTREARFDNTSRRNEFPEAPGGLHDGPCTGAIRR